jgi:hypothetical protein
VGRYTDCSKLSCSFCCGRGCQRRFVSELPAGRADVLYPTSPKQAGFSKHTHVESRVGPEVQAPSLQQTAPLEVKSAGIEPRPSHTLPRSGSRSLATSEHDSTCFPSASSARLEHPGGWPSRLLRAPGHEGVRCWYVATRTSDPDQSKSPLGISTIPHGAMRLIQFAARSTTTPSR